MTREEAVKIVRENMHLSYDDGNTLEALKTLVPELAESEDERIRKELIGMINECTNWLHKKDYVKYLEKQKEQKSREDIINETVKDKAFTIKLLKSAGILDETGELAEMYRSGQDSTECIPDSVKFDEGFKTGREVGFREGVKSVKSAEWSEEDEEKLSAVISLMISSRAVDPSYDKMCLEGWLKSLPKRFNLPLHQDWSEEDDMMLDKVCCLISPGTKLTDDNADYCVELKQWIFSLQERILKSLRPQPHWKPNKEQMSALDLASLGAYGDEDIEALKSLYNDLKKL